MIDPGSTQRLNNQLFLSSDPTSNEGQFSKFKEKSVLRLGKLKSLLKGVEDTRIMQVLKVQDYVALELVQPNA